MTAVLLDTHVRAWTLFRSDRLSREARADNDAATVRLVSPASLHEIAQKVRLGKWAEMAPFVGRFMRLLDQRGVETARLDAETCLLAGRMEWPHRDPFDRMLAATALRYGVRPSRPTRCSTRSYGAFGERRGAQWLSRGTPMLCATRWYFTAGLSTMPSSNWSTMPRWISCHGVWLTA